MTIPIGQDPNVRMELHISNECSVMTGRTKKSTQPHCANQRCKKPLFAPIRCDVSCLGLISEIIHPYRRPKNCNQQFCPQHRFPSDHTCRTTTVQTLPKPVTTTTPNVNTKTQNLTNEMSAKSNAAMAAFKRSVASTKSTVKPKPSSSSTVRPPQPVQEMRSSSTSSSSKTTLNPLSKTDR